MKYVTVELSEELARALLKDVEQVKPLSPEQCRAVAAELHNAIDAELKGREKS